MPLRASVLALSTSPRVLEKRPRPGNGASRFQRWVNGRVPGTAHAQLFAAAALPPTPDSAAARQPGVPPAAAAGRCGSGSERCEAQSRWPFGRGGFFSAEKNRQWPWLSGGCGSLGFPAAAVRANGCVPHLSQPRLPTGSAPPLRPLPSSWAEELMQAKKKKKKKKWFIPGSAASLFTVT